MCQARRARSPLPPAFQSIRLSANRRRGTPDISAHQVDQMLNRRALLFRGSGLRRYAVADLWTLIQKVPKPDPAGALRSFQNAPQTHPIHTRDAILKFLDIVYELRVYAPIVLII